MNMLKMDLQILIANGNHDKEILHLIDRILFEMSLLKDKVDLMLEESCDLSESEE